MKHFKLLLWLIVSFYGLLISTLTNSVNAQTLNQAAAKSNFDKVSQPNSENAVSDNHKEDKTEEIVKKYTSVDRSGDLSITVPMYVIRGKKLSLPLNLSYQAGVKVNQEASDVGLGWVLNFGKIVRDYGAYEPDYTSTLSESKMENAEGVVAPGLIDSKDNCYNCNFYPVSPFVHENNLQYNILENAITSQLTPDDYIVNIPGLNGNTFWNNGMHAAPHDFKWNLRIPWKIEHTTNTYEIPQEFSRINEVNMGTDINITQLNNQESFAAAIAIPPYVNHREFGKYVNSLYNNLGPFPDVNTTKYVKYEDFGSFTITIEDGTKYVFSKPLRGQKYLFSEDPYWSTISPVDGYFPGESLHDFGSGEWWKIDYIAEWLLTDVLSVDYEDTNLNGIPDAGDQGDWIHIKYKTPGITDQFIGFWTNYQVENYRKWEGFSQTDRSSSLMREIAYVESIETPIEKIDFITSERFDVTHDYFKRPANYLGNGYYIWDDLDYQSTNNAFIIDFPVETKRYDEIQVKSAIDNNVKNTIKLNYATKGSAKELAVSNYLILDNNKQENWVVRANQNTENLNYHFFPYNNSVKRSCFLNIHNSTTGRGKTTLLGIDIYPEDDILTNEKKSYRFEYNNNPSFNSIHSLQIFKNLYLPNVRQSFTLTRRTFPTVPGYNPYLPIPLDYGDNFYDFLSEYSYSTHMETNPTAYQTTNSNNYLTDLGYLKNNQSAWTISKMILPEGGELEFEYENDDYQLIDNNNWTLTDLPPIQVYNHFAKGRTIIQNMENAYNNIKHDLYREFSKSFDGTSGIRISLIRTNSLFPDAQGSVLPSFAPVWGEISYSYGLGHYPALPSEYWQSYMSAFSNFITEETHRHPIYGNYSVQSCGTEYFSMSPYERDNLTYVYDIRVDNSVKNRHFYENITETFSDGSTVKYYYNDPSSIYPLSVPYTTQKLLALKGTTGNTHFPKVFAIVEDQNAGKEPTLYKIENGSGSNAVTKIFKYSFSNEVFKINQSASFDFADAVYITPFQWDDPQGTYYWYCGQHNYNSIQSNTNFLVEASGSTVLTTHKNKQSIWKKLDSETEIVNGQPFTKAFYYTNPQHMQITEIEWLDINSDPGDPYHDYQYTKHIKYPLDYIIPTGVTLTDPSTYSIDKMQEESHIINYPIEEYTTIRRKKIIQPGDPDYTDPDPDPDPDPLIIVKDLVIGGKLFTYSEPIQRKICQHKIFNLELEEPLDISFFQISSVNPVSGVFEKDANYRIDSEVQSYDQFGNVSQILKSGSQVSSKLFDNLGVNVQMTCVNGRNSPNINQFGNEVSYNGFESGTTATSGMINTEDNWIFNNTSIVVNESIQTSHTGNYCQKIYKNPAPQQFQYSCGKEFIPTNVEQSFKFSCWIKAPATFSNNNGSLVLNIKVYNPQSQLLEDITPGNQGYFYVAVNSSLDWSYYEVVVDLKTFKQNQINLGNLSANDILGFNCYVVNYDLSSEIYVDDIRVQPTISLMETFTYSNSTQLISSKNDQNNLPSYYLQDNWGRPNFTLNFKKNLYEIYEYHQKDLVNPNDVGWRSSTILTAEHTLQDYLTNVIPDENKRKVINYLDGFNRVIQKVEKQFSHTYINDAKDKVTIYTYSKLGLSDRNYLPYIASTSDGSFKINAYSDLINFYSQGGTIISNDVPYYDNEYELGGNRRILKEASYGSDWQLGNGHEKTYEYSVPNQGDMAWVYANLYDHENGGNIIFCDVASHYQNPLKTTYMDEDKNKSYVYTDYENRKLWERREVLSNVIGNDQAVTEDFTNGQGSNDLTSFPNLTSDGNFILEYGDYVTRYLYDYSKRIVAVIPPEIVKINKNAGLSKPCNSSLELSPSNYTLHPNAFVYKYDKKGRIVEQQVGNKGLERFVYNNLNQVVLSQTATQRLTDEWSFNKYDALGRVIQTGLFYDGTSRETIQNQCYTGTFPLYEESDYSTGNKKYTNNSFPILSINDVLLVENYYDDYSFEHSASPTFQTSLNPNNTIHNMGMLTGNIVKVLDGTNTWLQNINYYDNYNNTIQSHSKHILNGWDIVEQNPDFRGLITTRKKTHSQGANSLVITNNFWYDHYDRLVDEYQQTGSDPRNLHLTYREYNLLGQEIVKHLHFGPAYGSAINSYMQHIDYRYNIRGWLTHINNSSLTSDNNNLNSEFDIFGQELSYQKLSIASQNFIQLRSYNGNISLNKWKLKHPLAIPSNALEHAYFYRYDNMNRMTAGYYSTSALNDPLSFNYNVNYFSEKITYDPIGNIINFKRWQKGGTIIDDLDYRYNPSTSAVKTNQFYQINDNCSILQTGYFNEAVQNPDEYTYNANGSLNSDNNKGCFTFYNHLELPAQINIGTQSIDFLYDAAGNKIAQHPSNENWTYFINGIEYEDNAAGPILKNIATSEGRVRPKDPYSAINPNITFVYDYFIKDYLGSIRAILSEEYFDRRYLATMEDQNSNAEEDLFYNIAESREENPPNKPTDYSYTPDEKVSLLNAWLGKPIGHAKLLEVNEGDNVSFTTKYFFEDAIPDTSSVRPIQSILNQLAGIFFLNTSYGPAGNTLESQQEWANNTFLMNASLSAFLNDFFSTIEGDPNYPNKAFVTYLMFDKEFNFVPEKSGVLLADQPNQLEQIGLLNIDIEKNGYFYVYVSNEGGRDVSFDLLQINNLNGFMRENNTYYPYGLLNPHLSFSNSYMNSKNNYKFQGKYLISNFDFNEMEFGLRYYNPVIGRWNAIDPQSQSRLSISGYNFVQNNPIIRIDPDGALDEWYKDAEGEMQFDPEVKNQEQARKKGGTYVGPTATETSKRGGSIEYRVDGSINFSNETDAYERMDKYGIKHESLAAIKTDGVLVLPTYLNDENSSYFAEYGYGFSPKGNLKDPVSNTTVTILGTLHTHLNKDFGDPDPSLDDVATFTHNTPNKPFATMGHDGKMHIGKGTSELLNWFNFPKGYVSNQNFLNGASLIDLYKQLRNK